MRWRAINGRLLKRFETVAVLVLCTSIPLLLGAEPQDSIHSASISTILGMEEMTNLVAAQDVSVH
jgi:hypothetical protein